MKIYLLFGCWNYDGEILLGAFTSREKAERHAQGLFYQGLHWKSECESSWTSSINEEALLKHENGFDWLHIQETDVQ